MKKITRISALTLSLILMFTFILSSNIMNVFADSYTMTIINDKNNFPYWTSDYTFQDSNGVTHTHSCLTDSGNYERVVQFSVSGQPYLSFCLEFWKGSASQEY